MVDFLDPKVDEHLTKIPVLTGRWVALCTDILSMANSSCCIDLHLV